MPANDSNHTHPTAGIAGRRMLYIMLAVTVLIALFLVSSYTMIFPKAPETATIRIPRNADNQTVADTLEKYFGSKYTGYVMRLIKLRNTDMSRRYGAYKIYQGTNPLNTMRQLTSGGQTPVNLTINGYRSFTKLIEKVSNRFEFPPDSLFKLVSDPEVMARYGLTPDNAIALFLDDSYQFYWTSTAREVIDKIGQNYLYVWDENRRAKADNLRLTPAQVMILASIVNEETNKDSEKGVIARLYINRLSQGMKLQADPTVRYAKKDFSIRRISHDDLTFESPYNTYLHNGLPPGAIRTSGVKTIDAILNSTPHTYLYMCAREDFSGFHNFATTYEEHLKNARRYQEALDKKGIKR